MTSRVKKILLLGTVVLALGGAGTGVALAQTSTTQTTTTTPITTAADSTAKHPGKHRVLRGLHGEFTTGGKQPATHVYQRGSVTAVSPTSLTVSSTDGFSATYVIDGATKVRKDRAAAQIGQVATGDRVVVTGVRNGTALDAKHVADRGVTPPK